MSQGPDEGPEEEGEGVGSPEEVPAPAEEQDGRGRRRGLEREKQPWGVVSRHPPLAAEVAS